MGKSTTGNDMNPARSDVLDLKEPSFYLFKHKDLDGLQLPLKGSRRVKVSIREIRAILAFDD